VIIILVDSREQNGSYICKFLISKGIEADIICFPQETGCDYLISGKTGSVAVQRKDAFAEVINQMEEIRYDILPRLKNFSGEVHTPVLLVEETFGITKEGYLIDKTSGRESQMLATSYYNFLETVRRSGADVVTTRDLNQSIWWMVATHTYLAKNHYPKQNKAYSVQEQAMGMMMSVNGIGEARAGKALAESSIKEMGRMMKIPGLTDKQSKKVKEVLGWKEK
jgi:hypothetical protein